MQRKSTMANLKQLRKTGSKKEGIVMQQSMRDGKDMLYPKTPPLKAWICCCCSKLQAPSSFFEDRNPVDNGNTNAALEPSEKQYLSWFNPPKLIDDLKRSGLNQRLLEQKWRLKRDSLGICFVIVLFNLTSLGSELPFVLHGTFSGEEEEERFTMRKGEPWINIGLALSTCFSISTCYLLLISWYNTLPSVLVHRALFQLNMLLVRYPLLIYRVAMFNIIGIWLVQAVVLVIVPLTTPNDIYFLVTQIYVATNLSFPLVFGVLQYIVIGGVIKIYRGGIEAFAAQ